MNYFQIPFRFSLFWFIIIIIILLYLFFCSDCPPSRDPLSFSLSSPGITVDKYGVIFFVDGTMIRRIDQNGIISTLLGFNDLTSARPLSCDSVMDISQVSCLLVFPLQLFHPSASLYGRVCERSVQRRCSATMFGVVAMSASARVKGCSWQLFRAGQGTFVLLWVPVTQMLPTAAGLRHPVSSWPTTWATELLPPSQRLAHRRALCGHPRRC